MRLCNLCLIAALPLAAQTQEPGKWNAGLFTLPTSLEGYFIGEEDGEALNLDLKRDLAIGRDGTKPGFHGEYQGHRFGLSLSFSGQDFKGSNVLDRQIEIGDTTYKADAVVNTKIKMQNTDLNWTIRCYNWSQAWVGVDLGIHAWKLDLDVEGTVSELGVTETRRESESLTLPIPQFGISGGAHAFNKQLVARASFHLLPYKGASYQRFQADVRYYPLTWVGVRVFVDNETFDVPKDSITDDLELNLDHSGVGFGVVFRF